MAIKKAVNVEAQSVTITFEDGSELVMSLSELESDIITQLALHGLSQKGGDSYAGDKDRAQELASAVWDNLKAGNWSVRGEGGPRVTQLVRALVMKLAAAGKEITEADAAAKVAELDDDSKKALQAALAPELAQVKAADAAAAAERAKKKAESTEDTGIDVAALLG
jgi:hypothetical protein